MRDIGVDWVRITAGWSVIAPAPLATRRPDFDATDPNAYPTGAWLPEAEQIARRQPSLRSVAQFLIRDLPERPGKSPRVRWGDYQSGLRYLNGRPKPAHASFALGLVARRAGATQVRFWGLVRPGAGDRDARISVREPDGSWREIARRRTHADGTFALTVAVDSSRTFRLRSGGRVGPPVTGAR